MEMRNLSMLVFLLLLGLTLCEPTTLTYYSEHEIQQQSDYIQIGITVHCEDSKLKAAVGTAKGIVEKLERIVKGYCESLTKKKSECDDVYEASKSKISPKYQLVRKVDTFIGFVVEHEITIKIRKLDNIGKMTDQLLIAGEGLIKIDKFDWEAENEQNPERQAISEGLAEGEEICAKMGLKMKRIVSIAEVEAKEQPQEEEQEEEQGQEDEENEEKAGEIIIFKFQVECE